MKKEDVYDEKNGTFTCISYGKEYEEMIKKYIDIGCDGSRIKMGLLDSGIIQNHPIIKGLNIIKTRDFTGEGIEDRTGHGTYVTLCTTYNGLLKMQLYIAKVIDEDNECSEKNVVEALEWLKKCEVNGIGMSLAFERKEKCDGSCLICKKVEELAKNGIFITVPAGNKPNAYFCPATSKYTMSVGALNDEMTGIAEYSAKGDFYAPCPMSFKVKKKKN